jgi:hypothetical protein
MDESRSSIDGDVNDCTWSRIFVADVGGSDCLSRCTIVIGAVAAGLMSDETESWFRRGKKGLEQ